MAKEELTVEKMAEKLNENIESLKSSIDEKADLAKLEERFTDLGGKFDEFAEKYADKEDISKQQGQLDEISTQLTQLSEYQKSKGKSLYEQIKSQMTSDDFKAKLSKASVKSGPIIELTKAADIDTDDINSGSIQTQTDPGVAKAPWRANPIWDRINKGIIGQGRDSVSWWEETTRTDSAEMVAENAAPSSGSAKTWTKQSMDIKMIKDYTKVSKSALEDFEYIGSEIQDLIGNGIPRKRENQLLTGPGTTVYLKGIDEYAKTFAKPSNFDAIASPNNGDVLAAAMLQVMNGDTSDSNKAGFMPNVVFVNPGDAMNIKLVKDSNYNYIRHPFLSPDMGMFDGVEIVPTLDLSAGTYIIGDMSRAKVYLKRAMNISFHYENEDDVLNDLVLVLASQRLAGVKISAPDAYAFVTGTFSAGKTAIATS